MLAPPRCSGLQQQRRRVLVATASIAAVLLLWPWLSLLTSTAYTYLWWQRPEVHWAPTPADVASNSSLASSAVPKIIHQTWKTTQVPAKWAAARQSCIDLHPDYEHRLWTDEDGLNFIAVSVGFSADSRAGRGGCHVQLAESALLLLPWCRSCLLRRAYSLCPTSLTALHNCYRLRC